MDSNEQNNIPQDLPATQQPAYRPRERRRHTRRKNSTMGMTSCGLAVICLILTLIAVPSIPAKHAPGVAVTAFLLLACSIFGTALIGISTGVMGMTTRYRKRFLALVGVLANPAIAITFLVYLWWPVPSTLVGAGANGDIDKIETAITFGIDINVIDELSEGEDQESFSGTAMIGAALNGHTDTVQFLVDHGAAFDVQDSKQRTALFHAVEQGHMPVVDVLLKAGADANLSPPSETCLYRAAGRGNVRMVTALLEHGADVNPEGALPLSAAAMNGYSNIIELLLKADAKINAADDTNDRNTALHLAAEDGHLFVVRMLLLYRADPKLLNRFKQTALELAINSGHDAAVGELINANSPIDIFAAIGLGDHKRVSKFLEKDTSLVRLSKRGRLPIHHAVERGEVEIVKMIVQAASSLGATSAIVNAPIETEGDITPLYLAVVKGHAAIALLLLDHEAAVNAAVQQLNVEAPVLYFAVVNGHEDLVDTLLTHGADVNVSCRTDNNDGPSLLFATRLGHVGVVKMLLAYRADPNLRKNRNTPTPLIEAVRNKHVELVQVLLEHKANPNEAMGSKTPMDIVKDMYRHAPEKFDAIRRSLMDHGAVGE